MTELLIDGVSVELPQEFNITVKQENPFFTKNGEYTYDIELSLNSPVNAKLYGFLNRLNNTDKIKTDRKAVLIADNRVYIDGTEIVTGWSDTSVQIQLVSGNSELNYFIGSDKLITELDMPVTNPVSGGTVSKNYIEKRYPDVEYNLAAIVNRTDDRVINGWLWDIEVDGNTGESYVHAPSEIAEYDFIPQPYLCAYIKYVLKAIGYSLEYNAIESTPWRDVYIAHVQPTYRWADILRGWTVKDFLTAVEKFFNATFVIDYKKKSAKLMLNVDYLPQVTISHVRNVDDIYSVQCEEPEADAINSNITYNLPSTSYYKLRRLSDVAKSAVKRRDVTGDLVSFFSKTENQVVDTVFNYPSYNRDLIYHDMDIVPVLEIIDEFADLVRTSDDSVSEYELDFVPVEIAETGVPVDDPEGSMYRIYLPVTDLSSTATEEQSYESVVEMAENLQESEDPKCSIFLGLYSGMAQVGVINYPMSYTDRYIRTTATPNIISPDGASFNLSDMETYFYSDTYDIDRRNPVEINSYDANIYPVTNLFEINNKRYLCREIEYTIGPDGRSGAWKGVFYPIRISDTEAESRWILADGTWRDNGVWLDDGRWLD